MEIFGIVLDPLWIWLAAGLALLMLELATGSLFLLWPALAALAMAGVMVAAPDLSLAVQFTAFALLGVVLTLIGRTYFQLRPLRRGSDRPDLNDRAAQLVGQRVSALAAFEGGSGPVKLQDSQWNARLADEAPDGSIAPGASLRVVRVEGATLIVEPT